MKLIHDVIGFARRVGALFGRRPRDRDLHDEIDFHLAMRQREYEAAGADPDEARLAARRRFGNVAVLERDRRHVEFPVQGFVQDTRCVSGGLENTGFSVAIRSWLASAPIPRCSAWWIPCPAGVLRGRRPVVLIGTAGATVDGAAIRRNHLGLARDEVGDMAATGRRRWPLGTDD
jgi:hypothetical protein